MKKAKPFFTRCLIDPDTGCWNWTSGKDAGGYGGLTVNRKSWKAHRYSWFLVNGPIPKGMCICHHCDNPSCINPQHLWIGTNEENIQDRNIKGRQAKGHKNRNARLNEFQIREIRLQQGKKINKELAKQYNISVSTINDIWAKRRWRHI